MRISDWSSDVCSSDLADGTAGFLVVGQVQLDGALDRFGEFFQRQQGIGVSDEVGFRDGGTAAIHHAVLHHGSVGIDAPALARCHHVAMVVQRHHRRSEEHTSELQSLMRISYAVICMTKKKTETNP